MANSYNVAALPNYVDQRRAELIAKAVLNAKSADLFTLQTGIKGETALNLISSEIVFGDGTACGWNEAGSTTLSQSIMKAKALKVNMAVCDKTLLNKWANYLVRVEAGKTDADLPFEAEFVEDVIKGVKANIEKLIYQGDGDNANEFDGLIKILDAANPVAVAGTAQESAYDFIKKVAAAMPAEVMGKEDAVILVSAPLYAQYMQDLVAANLYHYNPGSETVGEHRLPGTDIRVIAVNGLNGTATNEIAIGTTLSNLFYGTDLENGEEAFDIWYSKDNREFRLAIEFVAGVAVAFPAQVAYGKKARV